MMATQWVDLVWPTLLLAGWERVLIEPGITVVTPLDFVHYPFTHSLLAGLLWAGLVAIVYRFGAKSKPGALILGAAVLSHWVLDLLVHRPDLPLLPGGPFWGLGGWNSQIATTVLEALFFGGGVWLYAKATRAKDAVGRWSLRGLVAFIALIQVSNQLGPPPPSVTAIAWVGQAQWLLVIWGFWIDRHRTAVAPAA